MAPKDVCNMEEIALLYCAQPNKTLEQGEVHALGAKYKRNVSLLLLL